MLEARYAAAAAVVGGQLYIAGGADGDQGLRSAERFDPATNSWYHLPPMSCVRVRPGAAAIREVVDKDPNAQETEAHMITRTARITRKRTARKKTGSTVRKKTVRKRIAWAKTASTAVLVGDGLRVHWAILSAGHAMANIDLGLS
ncbi:unnamed protein product [Polarella glacialis]|uniref:Uncharacterized protein n=1 Tax=Polarella glacialis TaxID=89957 RepID=A0A813DZM6_POLGL|nr:unnamed protein product [Polarella glacialis]